MAQDEPKTDRARNWVVAACCFFTNLVFYGIVRMSGIMLVASTETFHVSRASAAVPFSLCSAVRNLPGLFVGHLGHRFGVGAVVATGCLFASLGAGLCFFAQDIQWLIGCWGIVFGFGFGLATCLLPLAINQNFVKHNGTASGISYSGSYFGSFIFPPVIVWLMGHFGFQGTFLIISGAVLNVLLAAILLRERKSNKKRAMSDSSYNNSHIIDHKEVSVICKNVELGEMWKQNINREFLFSQSQTTNEDYFKSSDCSMNAFYLLKERDRADFKGVSRSESLSKYANGNLNPDTNIHYHHHSLFKNFKFESTGSKDYEKISLSENPIFVSFNHPTKCSSVHSSRNTSLSTVGSPSKEVPIISKVYFRKLLENRLFSKGKCKAKYKLKLQKLKKALEASISKNRTPPTLTEFAQNGNVKLTSFKISQSFLYANPSSVYHCLHLSSLNDSTCKEKVADQSDCYDSPNDAVQYYSNTNFPTVLQKKPTANTYLVVGENGNLVNVHSPNVTSNNCDIPVKTSSYTKLSTHKTYDDDRSNNSSVSDDASSSSKTEDSQISVPEPSSSSELIKSMAKKTHSKSSKATPACFSDWFDMLREPMFVIISVTMSIHTLILSSIVTTIEDFAKDVGVSTDKTHYALMALSISNLIGTLTLGSITDRGWISRHHFLSLCFLGMSLTTVAMSFFAVSLSSLLTSISIYGLLESGVIITFPIVTRQFVKGERRQAVAIASSNVLSAPTVMLVPMLIGHFRDHIGCYSGLFQLLGGISFICSVLWLVAPSLCKKWIMRKKGVLNINDC